MENNQKKQAVKLPDGQFCGGNCVGCIYWNPYDRRDDGRQWCSYYSTYYYPDERNGCFARKD